MVSGTNPHSASPGGTCVVTLNSFFEMMEVDTNAFVGDVDFYQRREQFGLRMSILCHFPSLLGRPSIHEGGGGCGGINTTALGFL